MNPTISTRIKRYADLPPDKRVVFHGTNSLFAERFQRDGLFQVKHPLIEEGLGIIKEILDRPIPLETWMPPAFVIPKKSKAYQLESERWRMRLFPVEECKLSQSPGIYVTGSLFQAANYSQNSPEMARVMGEEDFIMKVKLYHGEFFDSLLKKLESVRTRLLDEFVHSRPVVLKILIPDLTYLRAGSSENALNEKKLCRT